MKIHSSSDEQAVDQLGNSGLVQSREHNPGSTGCVTQLKLGKLKRSGVSSPESPDFLAASGSSPPPLPMRLLTADISDLAKLLYVHLYSAAQHDWEFFIRTGWGEPNGWQVEGYDFSSLRKLHVQGAEPEVKQAAKELVEAGYLVVDEETGSYDVGGITRTWTSIRLGLTTKGVMRTPEEWNPDESWISTGFKTVPVVQS